MASIKQETISGIKWEAIGKYTNAALGWVIGIILARLLEPSDYGILGMIAVFFTLSRVFTDGGFSTALIRKKDATEVDNSTVFYYNLGVSLICYTIIFFSAPFVAQFYKIPELTKVLRLAALTIIISALYSIQLTLLKKRKNFKTHSVINVFVNIFITTPIVLWMAYKGYGVWALVYRNIFTTLSTGILLWIFGKWRPILAFSKASFKEFFDFGNKIVASSLLSTVFSNMAPILIGRFYTASDLGYYSKGDEVARQPTTSFYSVLTNVSLPILSSIHDDNKQLLNVYSKYIKVCSLIIFFVMMNVVALAKPLVIFLYSAKWEPSIIFLQLFSLSVMFSHVGKINLTLITAKGRSDIILKMEILKLIVLLGLMIASLPLGIIALCAATVIGSFISLGFNMFYTKRIFDISIKELFKDFLPYFFIAFFSCIPGYLLTLTQLHNLLIILAGGAISALLYFGLFWLKRDVAMKLVLDLLPIKNTFLHKRFIAQGEKV